MGKTVNRNTSLSKLRARESSLVRRVYHDGEIQRMIQNAIFSDTKCCGATAEFISELSSRVLEDEQLHILIPSIRALNGTANGKDEKLQRTIKIVDWATREMLPRVYWVDNRERATSLIDLEPVTDSRTAQAARKRVAENMTASGSRMPTHLSLALEHVHHLSSANLESAASCEVAVGHVVSGLESAKNHHDLSDEYLIPKIRSVLEEVLQMR